MSGAVGRAVNPDNLKVPQSLANNPSEQQKEKAYTIFRESLRALIDEWIDTGREGTPGEVIECPWDRKLTFEAKKKVFEVRGAVKVNVLDDGSIELCVDERPPIYFPLLQRAERYATSWFSRLLDNEARYKLFRCDNCMRYFVRNSAPRKGQYIKRGAFCEQCKNIGGAKRNEVRRRGIQGMRIDAAVEWWTKYPKTREPFEQWVIEKINRALKKKGINEPVKRNWLTRNRAQIEAEMERRKHA
ncbi:MAG TPA: hypothetical protein VFE38_00065 [Edaphobacter sp.]|nr:hypothetical protein [Edaphobacter sp.]